VIALSVLCISGQNIEVDIEHELSQFKWEKSKWTSEKLICASPFRFDKTPSFFVNIEGQYAGTWGDAGAYDEEWASGNFTKLLAFLRNETYEETEEYLRCEYGFEHDGETVTLRPLNLRVQRVRQSLNSAILDTYTEDYSYLLSRGIPVDVQRQNGVLYDPQQKAAVIPWRLPDGRLANVKYRKTYGKTFYYAKGAWPIRELVYGIERAESTCIICEAEIDALSWQAAGYSAVAVGGASFGQAKRDLILRSKISELLIATDNDKAGGKLRREIEQALRGYVRIKNVYVVAEAKDANEALVKFGVNSLKEAVSKAEDSLGLYVNLYTFGRG
jgi:DNA primase